MADPGRERGGTPLSPDEAAVLAEFGYGSSWVARTAKRKGGPERLARMAALARQGTLPPRDLGPRVAAAPRQAYPAGGGGDLRGFLAFHALLVPVAAGVICFGWGAVVLLSRLQGERGAYYGSVMPWWGAALLVAVPFALLDVLARRRGRRLLSAAPGPRRSEVRVRPAERGRRAVPPVLQELAFLPLLTLVPLVVVQDDASLGALVPLEVLTVVLLGACTVSMVLAGGPVAAGVLVAGWAGWAWIEVHRSSTPATLALLAVTLATGVLYFGRIVSPPGPRGDRPE